MQHLDREYEGVRYSTLVASDVMRDGIALELHRHWQNQDNVVAEVFFSDEVGKWTLSTFDCDVPLELIEQLISEAKERLGRGAE
ncbi:hypothetical protein [Inhella crocodyli]|uniref:hypothetical protein n=1 Tax=Inhella crocodyli TaxID=2499851 RepID=UPI000FD7B62F|nr:hypothetical protein [Inhella crocodyli]